MRVAIVHDWLTGMRGGERVLEGMLDLFAEAEIFTLVHVPGSVSAVIEQRPIHTSVLNSRLTRTRFRHLLPLFPAVIRRFALDGFDLILSSSHCVAKAVIAPPGVPHLCYCHTPMRYIWDQYETYFAPGRASVAVRLAMRIIAPRLRAWDATTATRPTRFVANSHCVRERIRRHYGRDACVVYPPVDVGRFRPAPRRGRDYLIVSALVPYKRIDLAIRAFNGSGRRLVVVGEGAERKRLERMAGSNVTFTGRLSDHDVAGRMAECRAFILPGEEDFGIAAVEAQAAGAPVIAFARGGALETVNGVRSGEAFRADATGVFFDEPTPDALHAAVEILERCTFDTAALIRSAHRFSGERFRAELRAQVAALLS